MNRTSKYGRWGTTWCRLHDRKRSLFPARLVAIAIGAVLSASDTAHGERPEPARVQAAAPRTRIVVLTPAAASASVRGATARVVGELVGVGFEVLEATMRRASAPREEVELADATDALAVFAIVETAAGPEIWISDRARGTTTAKRAAAGEGDPQRRTSALAFAAVELLRASLAEPWRRLEAERAADPPLPATAAAVAPVAREPAPVAPTHQADARWAPEALVGVRALTGPAVPVWSAGLRATFAFSDALSVAPELDVAGGSERIGDARASVFIATAAVGGRVRVAAAPVDIDVGVGLRGGVARLSGAPTQAWAPRTGVGPWAGPSVGVAVRTKRRPGLQVGLDLEGGYAVLTTAGTAPSGAELGLGGPWVALRAGFGWWR